MKAIVNAARITVFAVLAGIAAIAGVFIALALTDSGEAGAGQYAIHINFNETVTEAALDETLDILRKYDSDVDLAILESFPPQGAAIIESDDDGVCGQIVAELEAKPYVGGATCEPYTPPKGGDGDEPVTNERDN